jgi:hypothetical protein
VKKPGDLIVKDPGSDEPFGFDWTAWLAELGPGVLIANSTWTIAGSDAVLTVHDGTTVAGDLKTQAYFAAGTAGVKYKVTNRVTTNSSPAVTDERSFSVYVENR